MLLPLPLGIFIHEMGPCRVSATLLGLVLSLGLSGRVRSSDTPEAVNIGAVLSYGSPVGKAAKAAIEMAVDDVNADPDVLAGTRLDLTMEDTNCSPFVGSIGVLKVLAKDTVAIIGPQSSTVAHIISYISSGLRVPLVSFAATDPTLSSLQYPFFVRMQQTDTYQMRAMVDLIGYHGWRNVIAVYVDDDYGRNGIYALDDELAKRLSKVYRIALPVGASRAYISDMLQRSKVFGPRVYVVHANVDSGLKIFSIAQELQMITDEYAWLATDWLCTALGASEPNGTNNSLHYLQGIVGLCQHIPQSSRRGAFQARWSELNGKETVSSELNVYGLYAYDAVWAVARSIDDFLNESGNITFTSTDALVNMKGKVQFDKLRTFAGGQLLLTKLLRQNFTGVIGQVQFDRDQNLDSGIIYEVINIDGALIRKVGYWANLKGLSTTLPEIMYRSGSQNFSISQTLGNITWPGGKPKAPRGWVVATNERPLRIGFPFRVGYVEFVTKVKENHTVEGFCIDVFEAAVKLIPYNIPHQFVSFGDGHSNPSYSDLVNMVSDKVIDAAVGDIAITTVRTAIVDFTQPYVSTGLVIVVPIKDVKSNTWAFLRPFSVIMWCVTGAFFFLIGVVIWLLEHRVNSDFRGSPKRQCVTIFLFSFSTLFQSQQEDTLSTLGRFVMMVWLFLLMVITSSYTASLTSFLTVQQLSTSIDGIDSLIASNEPIGYQEGSFARDYMINALNIHRSRLVSLADPEAYATALQVGPKDGGVAAIVDELPYVELFLQRTSGFGIVGRPFTRSGWGFALPRGSPLPLDLSSAIMKLSENGDLQRIHDKWFCKAGCTPQTAGSSDSDQLHLSNFWGLFLICGIAAIVSLFIFLIRALHQYIRLNKNHKDPAEQSRKGCCQAIYSFFDFIDEKEEAIKNIFKQRKSSSQLRVV